jgi:hypothetical protein
MKIFSSLSILLSLILIAGCAKYSIDLSSPEKAYKTCSHAFLNNELGQFSRCLYKEEDLEKIKELKRSGYRYPLLTKIIHEEIIGKEINSDSEVVLRIRTIGGDVKDRYYFISIGLITYRKIGKDWKFHSDKNLQIKKAKKVGDQYIPIEDWGEDSSNQGLESDSQ